MGTKHEGKCRIVGKLLSQRVYQQKQQHQERAEPNVPISQEHAPDKHPRAQNLHEQHQRAQTTKQHGLDAEQEYDNQRLRCPKQSVLPTQASPQSRGDEHLG